MIWNENNNDNHQKKMFQSVSFLLCFVSMYRTDREREREREGERERERKNAIAKKKMCGEAVKDGPSRTKAMAELRPDTG